MEHIIYASRDNAEATIREIIDVLHRHEINCYAIDGIFERAKRAALGCSPVGSAEGEDIWRYR